MKKQTFPDGSKTLMNSFHVVVAIDLSYRSL